MSIIFSLEHALHPRAPVLPSLLSPIALAVGPTSARLFGLGEGITYPAGAEPVPDYFWLDHHGPSGGRILIDPALHAPVLARVTMLVDAAGIVEIEIAGPGLALEGRGTARTRGVLALAGTRDGMPYVVEGVIEAPDPCW